MTCENIPIDIGKVQFRFKLDIKLTMSVNKLLGGHILGMLSFGGRVAT